MKLVQKIGQAMRLTLCHVTCTISGMSRERTISVAVSLRSMLSSLVQGSILAVIISTMTGAKLAA
jgi:hypothetical protein